MSESLRKLWDALQEAGCRPHGREYDFRARCPGHDGDNRESLHVSIGADGRAVLWCFARQCRPERICEALGLSLRDLFPPGHPRAETIPLRPVKRSDFRGAALEVVNVLFALGRRGGDWRLQLVTTCPYCGSQGAWLRADQHGLDVDCELGCDARQFSQALLGLLQADDARKRLGAA